MPLTILIADDDLGTRLSIGDYFETVGYSVLRAENGQEALKMVEKFQPHLIVTDVMMPQMDGYEFIRQVRQQPVFRLLPVVFLTARTETHERIRGYQLGCDVYLPKPFELQELGAVVRHLLERLQMIEMEWRSRSPLPNSADHAALKNTNLAALAAIKVKFTKREQEVVMLLSDGLSNAQIGDRLHLSPRTVEKYVSSLLDKTDTSNRAELMRFAIDHHLV
ncbi:response regulator transcription factor [Phormidium sp. CLA17]|uniref:response regulator transcription factor n=1 Tax=Leptolyngbya sp. Cla-17 TaxID=2803751 RepID=UPI0014929F46|nr:response regulator transcription factor [Leptolyngbya sp. Cla-17]MBM0741787.1 response regulator transcription factor [Leptolyngbya sp. Cla-17]